MKRSKRQGLARHRELLEIESALWKHGFVIAGVDEVGAGPLAGPVTAACVVLDAGRVGELVGVDDSKALSEGRREELAVRVREAALAVAIGRCSVEEVDRLNIRTASLTAMVRAFEKVAAGRAVDHLLVDARTLPEVKIPQSEIIKGDARSLSIAAASIVAKVDRDSEMVAADGIYPGYGFAVHKGYGTAAHLAALHSLGPCAIHRRSFAPVREAVPQRELF